MKNYAQIKMIEQKYKRAWMDHNHFLLDESGIYILTRVDENGFRYAYIGQSVNIVTRLAQHMTGYQHIDLSLKKHKIYSDANPYGWKATAYYCKPDALDEMEREFIQQYANKGYQLRNKTIGGQDSEKQAMDVDSKPSKGYYEGVEHGKTIAKRYVKEIFEKYLDYAIKGKSGKIKERKMKEFEEWING